MINTESLIWQSLYTFDEAPKSVQLWLNDEHSLTAKLKSMFADFSVTVLSQQQIKPHAHEAEIMQTDELCVVREVELMGDGQVVVFARSVIPVTPDTKQILEIGAKPLGEVLFNQANIQRSPMQITHTGTVWGRRSLFTLGNTKLLVSEFFMENLYA